MWKRLPTADDLGKLLDALERRPFGSLIPLLAVACLSFAWAAHK
jgi:hypothetical protein